MAEEKKSQNKFSQTKIFSMFVKINKTKNMYDLKKKFLRRLQLPEALLKTKKKKLKIFLKRKFFFSHFAKKEKNLLCPINDYTYFL